MRRSACPYLQHCFSVATGRSTVARSPQESDKSGLLREAEPVAYSTNYDPFADGDDMYNDDVDTSSSPRGTTGALSGGYQAGRSPRPASLHTSGGRGSSTQQGRGSGKSGARGPPRGIFDDI